MRRSLRVCQKGTPFEGAAAGLMRGVKGPEFRKVRRHRQQREAGTNELHKAQYINAFVEARATALTRSARLDAAAVELSLVPATAAPHTEQLRALAAELEGRYGATRAPARASASPARRRPAAREAVAFGAWRADAPALRRQSAAADFVLHCALRGARTPPGWSAEAFGRLLPLEGRPLRGLLRHTDGVAAAAGAAAAPQRSADLAGLRARETAVADRELHLDAEQRRAVTSLVLQRLVRGSGSWEAGHDYLLHHIPQRDAPDGDEGGSSARPRLRGEHRRDVSQQIAVFAEAVRFLDLPLDALPPLTVLERLLQAARDGIAAAADAPPTAAPRNGLDPVVAAPVLSIAAAPGDAAAVRRLCERHLFHRRRAGRGGSSAVYLPAVAWGEYLRAMGRSGATTAEIQRATDDITDPQRTQNAEELLSSAHVWGGYLSSVDGPHAVEVFEANKAHYGLRETPATTAALMHALATRGGSNPADSAQKGLALYARLQTTAAAHAIGTAAVLSALLRLHAATADLHAVLHFAVNYPDVLLYLQVPEEWWVGESGGPALLEQLRVIDARDTVALLSAAPAYAAFFRGVCEAFDAPPAVRHAFDDALAATEAAHRSAAAERRVELTAEDLADMM